MLRRRRGPAKGGRYVLLKRMRCSPDCSVPFVTGGESACCQPRAGWNGSQPTPSILYSTDNASQID